MKYSRESFTKHVVFKGMQFNMSLKFSIG